MEKGTSRSQSPAPNIGAGIFIMMPQSSFATAAARWNKTAATSSRHRCLLLVTTSAPGTDAT